MALQHGMREDELRTLMGKLVKRGLRFDHNHNSAGEHCESVLFRLGIIDDDGFVIGELPWSEDEVRRRLSGLGDLTDDRDRKR